MLPGVASMSKPRRAVVVLLLAACAGWETSTPSYSQPPFEEPTPSHHSPPRSVMVEPGDPSPTPEPPPAALPGDRIAIASVQLLNDCPDPEPELVQTSRDSVLEVQVTDEAGKPTEVYRRRCAQSMMQMAVRSDHPGQLRVEAVRLLEPTSKRVVGRSTLRHPTTWDRADGTYAAWDEHVMAATDYQTSYKLGRLDFSAHAAADDPDFHTYYGPFILELDVSIDGRRQTVRSPEFQRDRDIERVVT